MNSLTPKSLLNSIKELGTSLQSIGNNLAGSGNNLCSIYSTDEYDNVPSVEVFHEDILCIFKEKNVAFTLMESISTCDKLVIQCNSYDESPQKIESILILYDYRFKKKEVQSMYYFVIDTFKRISDEERIKRKEELKNEENNVSA
jgi:hypothetical protein